MNGDQSKLSFKNIKSLFWGNKVRAQNEIENKVKEAEEPLINNENISLQTIVNKKAPELLPEKLVSNVVIKEVSGVWEYPPLSLLTENQRKPISREHVHKHARIIEQTAYFFGIKSRVLEVNLGPFGDQYIIETAEEGDISKLTELKSEFALTLEIPENKFRLIKIEDRVNNVISLEIKNDEITESAPSLRELLASKVFQSARSKLVFPLGIVEYGSTLIGNLSGFRHLLITASNVTELVNINNIAILSLIFRASPQEVRFIIIDPKCTEFPVYNGIPHLLTPVIVEPIKAPSALKWAISETEKRNKLFIEKGVNNINSYNEFAGFQVLPYIVVVIFEPHLLDYFADVYDAIVRLIEYGSSCGVHLVISESTPYLKKIKKITESIPCIKVNLNTNNLEELFLFKPGKSEPERILSSSVSREDIKKVVEFLKSKNYPIEYTEEVSSQQLSRDGQLEDAIRLVCQFNTVSPSFLQRKMLIGYARATRIMDQLEELGIIGPSDGAKPRDVLFNNAEELLSKLK